MLLNAWELGLIGKERFAIDGCKLPSNASKKWSGPHKDIDEKHRKLERIAERIVQRHRDGQEGKSARSASEPEKAQRYRRKVAEIKALLAKMSPWRDSLRDDHLEGAGLECQVSATRLSGMVRSQSPLHADFGRTVEVHTLARRFFYDGMRLDQSITIPDYFVRHVRGRATLQDCPVNGQHDRIGCGRNYEQ